MKYRYVDGVIIKKAGMIIQYEKKDIEERRKTAHMLYPEIMYMSDQEVFNSFIKTDFKRSKRIFGYKFLRSVEYIG